MFAYSNSYIKVYLYDDSGNVIAVSPGTPIGTGSSGFIVFGQDGSGLTTAFSVDSSGSLSIQNPPNLDVPLSTLLSEAVFTDRINTLGQKSMSGSTPVVISSDQSRLLVETTVANSAGTLADIIVRNGQGGLKVEYPLFLEEVKDIKKQLIKIVKHLQTITEEEWDDHDDD